MAPTGAEKDRGAVRLPDTADEPSEGACLAALGCGQRPSREPIWHALSRGVGGSELCERGRATE